MVQVKEINIKNGTYYFFDDMNKFSLKLTKNRQEVV